LRQKLETAEAAAETGDVIPHDELEAGYHVLAGTVEVYIGNAHELRGRPGKKTDKRNTVGSKNSCGFAL
jgi:hypothetical protein